MTNVGSPRVMFAIGAPSAVELEFDRTRSARSRPRPCSPSPPPFRGERTERGGRSGDEESTSSRGTGEVFCSPAFRGPRVSVGVTSMAAATAALPPAEGPAMTAGAAAPKVALEGALTVVAARAAAGGGAGAEVTTATTCSVTTTTTAAPSAGGGSGSPASEARTRFAEKSESNGESRARGTVKEEAKKLRACVYYASRGAFSGHGDHRGDTATNTAAAAAIRPPSTPRCRDVDDDARSAMDASREQPRSAAQCDARDRSCGGAADASDETGRVCGWERLQTGATPVTKTSKKLSAEPGTATPLGCARGKGGDEEGEPAARVTGSGRGSRSRRPASGEHVVPEETPASDAEAEGAGAASSQPTLDEEANRRDPGGREREGREDAGGGDGHDHDDHEGFPAPRQGDGTESAPPLAPPSAPQGACNGACERQSVREKGLRDDIIREAQASAAAGDGGCKEPEAVPPTSTTGGDRGGVGGMGAASPAPETVKRSDGEGRERDCGDDGGTDGNTLVAVGGAVAGKRTGQRGGGDVNGIIGGDEGEPLRSVSLVKSDRWTALQVSIPKVDRVLSGDLAPSLLSVAPSSCSRGPACRANTPTGSTAASSPRHPAASDGHYAGAGTGTAPLHPGDPSVSYMRVPFADDGGRQLARPKADLGQGDEDGCSSSGSAESIARSKPATFLNTGGAKAAGVGVEARFAHASPRPAAYRNGQGVACLVGGGSSSGSSFGSSCGSGVKVRAGDGPAEVAGDTAVARTNGSGSSRRNAEAFEQAESRDVHPGYRGRAEVLRQGEQEPALRYGIVGGSGSGGGGYCSAEGTIDDCLPSLPRVFATAVARRREQPVSPGNGTMNAVVALAAVPLAAKAAKVAMSKMSEAHQMVPVMPGGAIFDSGAETGAEDDDECPVEATMGEAGEWVYSFKRTGRLRRGKWSRLEEEYAKRTSTSNNLEAPGGGVGPDGALILIPAVALPHREKFHR